MSTVCIVLLRGHSELPYVPLQYSIEILNNDVKHLLQTDEKSANKTADKCFSALSFSASFILRLRIE